MKIFKRLSLGVLFVVIVNGFIQLKTNSYLLSQTVLALCCNEGDCNDQQCNSTSTVLSEDYDGCYDDDTINCQTCIEDRKSVV